MTPFAILSLIVIYFGILFAISHFTSKDSGNDAFFKEQNSKWYLVASE
jgi:hypothetical protein